MIDATHLRAYHTAESPLKNDLPYPYGVNGLNSKLHIVCDGERQGRASCSCGKAR
ncbi:hypothetical protein EV129_10156 [Rhizobium azibense]|uniref:Uncharacterized protein n=1 Tax=Rhizobium azibense TaxID=1136135 RepID=A0A4R3RYI7_9HYPH|nr:hypothetical protein EV129_10156 [Rhizobium azibense]